MLIQLHAMIYKDYDGVLEVQFEKRIYLDACHTIQCV